MPTGYTESLDNSEMDTKEWILTNLSRAFGICVMIKDEGYKTEEELIKALQKEAEGGYYKRRLKKAERNYGKLKSRTREEWKKAFDKEVTRVNRQNKEWQKEAAIRRKKHETVAAELEKVKLASRNEVTRNICNFGLEQLQLVKGETIAFSTEPPESLTKWEKKELDNARYNVSYYKKELKNHLKRNKERLDAYLKLKKDVEEILGC